MADALLRALLAWRATSGSGQYAISRTVRLGRATLEVPAEQAEGGGGGEAVAIDSPATTWRSSDLRLLVDVGPFADRLDGYESRAGYERSDEQIAGRPARLVRFEGADGWRVVAVHLPAGEEPAATLVIEASPAIDPDALLAIARSLTL